MTVDRIRTTSLHILVNKNNSLDSPSGLRFADYNETYTLRILIANRGDNRLNKVGTYRVVSAGGGFINFDDAGDHQAIDAVSSAELVNIVFRIEGELPGAPI